MVQTALVGIIFLSMSGSMISGVVLSRYVFAFFPKHGGYELAQQVHILCAYWGFVCMSLHLGFHWSMMLAMARKHLQPSPLRTWSLRLIGWLWAAYGTFAFRRRGVSLYLLLRSHFVFYDYSEPVILFLIDYLSVMVMFVLIGYYASQAIKKINSTHPIQSFYRISIPFLLFQGIRANRKCAACWLCSLQEVIETVRYTILAIGYTNKELSYLQECFSKFNTAIP